MNNKVQNGKKINIGLDATLFSGETMKAYKSALDKANFQFVFPEKNLIDELKTQIKVPEPNFSERLIFVANPQEENDKFGVTRHHSDKLEIIRSAMRQRNSYFLLNAKLDDVAWALNLRGKNFVECCPVFHAFLLISLEKAWFFVNDSFFSKESGKKHSVFEHLKERNENIEILPYETIKSFDFEKNLTIPEKYLTQKINVWLYFCVFFQKFLHIFRFSFSEKQESLVLRGSFELFSHQKIEKIEKIQRNQCCCSFPFKLLDN